jgi:ATP-dependent Clp protease protease subunit
MTEEAEIHDPLYVAALIEKVKAQTEGQKLDNELARALAITAELATDREKVRAKWDKAAPHHHRRFYLNGVIDKGSVELLIDTLSRWDLIDREEGSDRPYTLVITSPGGDVTSGFQAYSYLKGLGEKRVLRISASGICASMATILHQAATQGERIIEPGCTYLLHEVSGGVGGRLDSIIDTTEWMKQLNSMMHKIFAEVGNKSEDELAALLHRHEKFLSVEEVIEWGLADKIEYVS